MSDSDRGRGQAGQTCHQKEAEGELPEAPPQLPGRPGSRGWTTRRNRAVIAAGTFRPALVGLRLPIHTGILRPWPTLAVPSGGAGSRPAAQYVGRLGSTWLIQASTPPPTWTASEKPAFLTTARASALRTPLLQCSTIRLSCGSLSSATPVRNWSFGI